MKSSIVLVAGLVAAAIALPLLYGDASAPAGRREVRAASAASMGDACVYVPGRRCQGAPASGAR